MRFLERERSTMDKFLPGLDERLTGHSLSDTEKPGSPAVADFRECNGPALLVPSQHGGLGATALDSVRLQRALGSRSPSLAVATTMHHFSVASLVVLSETSQGFEWMLLEAVATGKKLLASGWAEGRPDRSILQPTMTAVAAENGGVLVSGVKRPCSLARSMDLLTGSALVPRLDGEGEQLAVLLVPADAPGITVSPFWGSFALAGAESDQVTLTDVAVPEELMIRTEVPPGRSLDDLTVAGFVWFELLMAASYLGAASALVERVLQDERVNPADRLALVVELEGAMAGVEAVAHLVPAEQRDEGLLVRSLLARYAAQDAIARAVPKAVELLGGMQFIRGDDVGYLAAAVNGLGFHPPARSKMAGPLAGYLLGEPLTIA
jgi:alkylation response protein AidB-like acyl-CoA dehydrogenase